MFPHSKNLHNCCRTCLNSTSNMYDIFSYRSDSLVSDIMSYCINIQVEQNDALPKRLCSSCYNCLISFYDFRKQAEKIETELKTCVHSSPGQDNNIIYSIEIKPETDDDCIDFDHDYELEVLKKEPQLVSVENECLKLPCDITNEPLLSSIKPVLSQEKDLKYYCNVCKKSFTKIEKFQIHLTKHKKKMYKCNLCLKTFTQKSRFIKHIGEHDPDVANITEVNQKDENQKVQCDICYENFISDNLLSTHMQVHKEEDSIRIDRDVSCSQCLKKFKSVSDLVHHESIQHYNQDKLAKPEQNDDNEISIKCDICFAKFKSINSLSAHKRVHIEKGRILACSSCGKVFKKMNHLKRHELTHDVNRPFKCNVCPKSFLSESMLKEHVNMHCGVKSHTCRACSKSFACLSTLKKHIKTHTKERVYMCSICGKTFVCSSNLNQHMKRHLGLKTFSCALCPCSFVSKGELNSHNITHTGERAYSCDQCGATFTKRSSLKKHMLVHMGVRPHQCETCSMRFSSKDHLKRHIRIHTGEKPYRCELCERAFTQSNDLVKHRRAHLGDKLYRCSECSESFRLKTELRQHISEHFISSRLQTLNKIMDNPIDVPDTRDKNPSIEASLIKNVNNAVGNIIENSIENTIVNDRNPIINTNKLV